MRLVTSNHQVTCQHFGYLADRGNNSNKDERDSLDDCFQANTTLQILRLRAYFPHRTKGFMQKVVMFKLGLFPWECNACWKVFMSSERGKRTRRNRTSTEGSSLETHNA
jgi:hypothetical protein